VFHVIGFVLILCGVALASRKAGWSRRRNAACGRRDWSRTMLLLFWRARGGVVGNARATVAEGQPPRW